MTLRRKSPLARTGRLRQANAYTQKEWRAQVRRIRKRSGGICEAQIRCGGNPVQGDPHHLSYRDMKNRRRVLVEDSDLVDCCRPCHLEFERRKAAGEEHVADFLEGNW